MNPLRRNVLVFHLGALGDFVLSWPLAMALGRMHPQSRIIYVTHGQKGLLAEKLLRVESNDVETGWHALYSDAGRLPEKARRTLAGAHSVYSFVASENDEWAKQVRTVAPDADLCCLNPRAPEDYEGHSTEHLLAQLASRKAMAEGVRQMVMSLSNQGLGQRVAASGPVVIHPGAGAKEKCWPSEKCLELVGRLRDAGKSVRVVLGEVELERWPAKTVGQFKGVAEVATPGTYLELAKVLSDAAAFVGNDSGPGHLAGVMGVPTVSLFGTTEPRVWRPMGPRVTVLRGTPIESISVEEVLAALSAWTA